jgi:hypothetical protein
MVPDQADKMVSTLEKGGEWKAGKDIANTNAAAARQQGIDKRADDQLLKVREAHNTANKGVDDLTGLLKQVDGGNEQAMANLQIRFAEHEIVEGA